MHLEKIHLKGFKSFKDDTTIEFNNKLTAIVGANGSGKSNISDAVMWVLGEQSHRNLRASNMEDVIFCGSKDSKSANYAQVDLYLSEEDTSNGKKSQRIKISRKLYRNDISEFAINDRNAKLKDIRDLFFSTGLGKDGYSIISQGKVDRILNLSNKDRREIFDEATKIARYKYKKVDTLRNLKAVENKLLDMTKEYESLSKDLEFQRKQYENFNSYKKLSNKQNKLVEVYFDRQKKKLKNRITELNLKLQEISSLKFQNIRQLKGMEKSLILNRQNLEKLSKELNKLISDKESITLTEYDLKKSIEIDRNNSIFIERDLERLRKDKVKNLKYLNKLDESIRINEDKKSKLESDIGYVEDNITSNKIKTRENTNNILVLEKKLKLINDNLQSIESKLYNFKLLQKTYLSIDERNITSSANLLEILNNLKAKDCTLKDSISKDENDLEKLKIKLSANLNEIKNLKEEIEKISKKRDELNIYFQNEYIKLKKLISDYKSHISDIKNKIGYNASVSDFLQLTKKSGYDKYYVGSLAELMTVKKGYEQVINTLLSHNMQSIVTKNKEDTKVLIDFVNKNKLGRITFLPISEIKSRHEFTVNNNNNIIATAEKLIFYDMKYHNIFSYLLSNCLVVKNIDDAVKIRPLFSKFKIITMNLDIINPWGSMIAGRLKYKSSVNLINREQKLRELKIDIVKQRGLVESYKKELISIGDLVSKKREEEKIKQKNINNYIENIEKTNNLLTEKRLKLSNVNYKMSDIQNQLKILDTNDNECGHEVSKLEEAYSKRQSDKKELLEQLNKSEEEKRYLELESIRLNNQLEIFKRDKQFLENNKSEYLASISNINEDLKLQKKASNELKNNLDIIKQQIEVNNNLLEEKKLLLLEIKKNISDIEITQKNVIKKIENINNDIASKKKIDLEYDHSREKLEINIENLEENIENLQNEKLSYMIELNESCVEDMSINTDNITKSTIIENLKRIKNIGFFDEDISQTYPIILNKYNDFKKHINELQDAKDNIKTMLLELDTKMKKIFRENFDKINDNFKKIFETLFAGGNAYLKLDCEDILSSGIEIIVSPPGKKVNNINLLSGGEKTLTAISLLLAIFEFNPTPFCFLDEIDANLDDNNIERYINYIANLSNNIQFIMITHRQITMRMASRIYGVTMQKKGESKIYRVDFK